MVILFSGILLLLRKDISFIRPQTIKTNSKEVLLSPNEILNISKNLNEANIKDWNDISHYRTYYNKGYVLVRTINGYQIQIDGVSGDVLSHGENLSEWLIKLHEGSLFGNIGVYGIYLPASFLFLILLITGLYLYFVKRPAKKSTTLV